jgi:hypothetical protein
MGEKILTNDGLKEIEVIDIPSTEKREVFAEQEQPRQESVPIKRTERKEAIKEFNQDPRTREYGARLVDKKIYISIWIIAGFLILILSINMIWGNLLLGKLTDKDFSVNVQPSNVSMTDADINNIFNNFTIVNNITLPSNLTVNCRFVNSS